MKTAWRELAVRDAHVHFLSSVFYDTLSKQKGAPIGATLTNLGIEEPSPDPAKLAERWVQELDRHGVESAVLIASVPRDENSVLKAVQLFPERFYAYFIVDPTQADAAERVRSSLDLGARGVCFFPAMHRYAIYDERVVGILDIVGNQPGLAVFVHCGVLSVGIRRKIGLVSQFDMRFSNPIDLHGIALRYPHLNFVMPHFGAGFFREALMVADLCPNVYFDTSSSNEWVKYLPGLTVRDAFQQALKVVGPQRLLFGTDSSVFPRGWVKSAFDTQTALLQDLDVGADDAELILGANLRRMLSTPGE